VSTSTPQSSTNVDRGLLELAVEPSDQAAPPDLSWTVAYGNSWPTSASTGPMKTVDGIAQCFAHSRRAPPWPPWGNPGGPRSR
jgi:hypothetical protein